MAAHTKRDTLLRIRASGAVAVFHDEDAQAVCDLADALCRGGFEALEFTQRGSHPFEAFAALERWMRRIHPGCVVGAGSVIDAASAAAFLAAGADFIVGPALVPEVATLCNRRQAPYIPGCGSLTEMLTASELGCEVVKAFPASAIGGPDFIKAVLGPCPWLQILPTGGVGGGVEELKPWFDAGAYALGLGSTVASTALIEARDYDEITARAKAAMTAVAAARTRRR